MKCAHVNRGSTYSHLETYVYDDPVVFVPGIAPPSTRSRCDQGTPDTTAMCFTGDGSRRSCKLGGFWRLCIFHATKQGVQLFRVSLRRSMLDDHLIPPPTPPAPLISSRRLSNPHSCPTSAAATTSSF